MATPQTQAVYVANNLISIAQTLYGIEDQINQMANLWTQNTMGAIFNAMGTFAFNTDGSIGQPDATPNNAHPINMTYGLSRAISANNLATLNTLLGAVASLLSGASVSQQGEAPQLLAALVGG